MPNIDPTQLISLLFGGGSVLFLIVKEIQNRKTARVNSEIELKKESKRHISKMDIEKFNLEKIKELKIQEDNEAFQKEIINEIFSKYVKQNDWITKIFETKFEELSSTIIETKKELKDVRILNDKMNLQIKNIDDKVIKNTNIIIAKTDSILKMFSSLIFSNNASMKDDLTVKDKQMLEKYKKE